VVLTPHLGFVTAEGYAVFFGQAVEAILAFLDGKTPPRVVAPRRDASEVGVTER
jgi:phosphoglycerate dehydrogenase-like enzyme